MNVPVETMIRTHLQRNDAVQETVEWVEIVARLETEPVQIVGPVATPVQLRQRRWRPIAVAVAAVVVLMGGMALLFQVTEPDSPVITQLDPVPTTVPETTPTTVQATTPPPGLFSSSGWFRVDVDSELFPVDGPQGISSVTVGGPGLVAVGWDEGNPAVWTSVDGFTWSRVPHDETVFGRFTPASKSGEIGMRSVTAGGPGLVAVGWDGETNDDSDAAVWTSPDGITWTRVPHDEAVFGAAFMTSVTAGGPGLVAVGMDLPEGDGDAAVWTSVDGVNWSRVAHDEAVFGGPDNQNMSSVTVGGPGLVAVGWDGDQEPGYTNGMDAAVWTSVDGINWTRVPHDEAVFGGIDNPAMLDVTAGGPGLVAVGVDVLTSELAKTPVWTSPDGITWTRVPDDVTVRGVMRGVTAVGPGLVAVGSDTSEVMTSWTSIDGIKWSQVDFYQWDPGPGYWLNGVTVGGPGLVAFGVQGGDPAAWVWEAEDE